MLLIWGLLALYQVLGAQMGVQRTEKSGKMLESSSYTISVATRSLGHLHARRKVTLNSTHKYTASSGQEGVPQGLDSKAPQLGGPTPIVRAHDVEAHLHGSHIIPHLIHTHLVDHADAVRVHEVHEVVDVDECGHIHCDTCVECYHCCVQDLVTPRIRNKTAKVEECDPTTSDSCVSGGRGCPDTLPDHAIIRDPRSAKSYVIKGNKKHIVKNCNQCGEKIDLCDLANMELYLPCVNKTYQDGPEYNCENIEEVMEYASKLCPPLDDNTIVRDGRKRVYVVRDDAKYRVPTCYHCGTKSTNFCEENEAEIIHPCVEKAYPDGGIYDCKVSWDDYTETPTCPKNIANFSIVRESDKCTPVDGGTKESNADNIFVVVGGKKYMVPSCNHCGENFDFCKCENLAVDDPCVKDAWGGAEYAGTFDCKVDFKAYLDRARRGGAKTTRACDLPCPTPKPTSQPTTKQPSKMQKIVTLEAYTMENPEFQPDTKGLIVASFKVDGKWYGPFDFFEKAKVGDILSATYDLIKWPTELELATMSADTWGVWKITLSSGGVSRTVLEHPNGSKGSKREENSKYWLGSKTSYDAIKYEVPCEDEADAGRSDAEKAKTKEKDTTEKTKETGTEGFEKDEETKKEDKDKESESGEEGDEETESEDKSKQKLKKSKKDPTASLDVGKAKIKEKEVKKKAEKYTGKSTKTDAVQNDTSVEI
ncbi:hypothetical protein AAMO2058_000849500 [Amorphochlora amoebiformis]